MTHSCAARAPWIAGPTNHGVARCMDSILERMRGKQSKCLAIRPPGGHIFQCVPLIGLGARMAACWRPGELPSGGAPVEVLSSAGTPNPPSGPTSGGSGPKQLRGGWECPRTPSQRPRCRRSAKSAHGVGHRNPLRAVGLTMSVVFSSHLPIGRMCVVGLAVGRRWGYRTRVVGWCLHAVPVLAATFGTYFGSAASQRL